MLARMGRRFHDVYAAVSQALRSTPRSSSLVENLNSRLRVCLTNRRHLNGGRTWIGLLQIGSIIAALRAADVQDEQAGVQSS